MLSRACCESPQRRGALGSVRCEIAFGLDSHLWSSSQSWQESLVLAQLMIRTGLDMNESGNSIQFFFFVKCLITVLVGLLRLQRDYLNLITVLNYLIAVLSH